ncbi:PH domain-containing protein [Ornithinibacillus californiensis]|uniref:PH domain-containing protein n=1 Tax=Ornithinibacillus californiensis TaxID=161536 RepID=UPI00064D82FA|nr:PH domain-containing protein [Ornithinibacillus californiensis]
MYFPSKRDLWLTFIIWGAIFLSLFVSLNDTGSYFSLWRVLLLVIIIPLMWLWFKTGYMVKDGKLRVIFGPFRKTIMISELKKVTKSSNPLAAPALSVDRLKIEYGNYNVILISPKNEQEFINLLLKEDVNIELDENVTSNL